MFGFGAKKNIFLGLDVGTSSIKMVEIKVEDNKPYLANYAWMPLDDSLARGEGEKRYYGTIVPACIKKMIKEAGFTGKNAYVSLPAAGGLVTLIEFPVMEEKDIEQAIRYEAHKYIPTSLDEVVLSWDIIKNDQEVVNRPQEASSDPGKTTQIVLVAASKNKVVRYEGIVKKAGLKLCSIELENFSMVNSLIGQDGGKFLVVDIGSKVANIMLVEKGIIKINRNVDAGGRNITLTIAKAMGIDEARAEKLKTSSKNFFSKESFIDFPAIELIISEIRRILSAVSQAGNALGVDGIILSGGSANMTGLSGHISEKTGIKVTTGNCLSRVSYPQELEPAMKRIKTQFSVAVGLAMKGANDVIQAGKK